MKLQRGLLLMLMCETACLQVSRCQEPPRSTAAQSQEKTSSGGSQQKPSPSPQESFGGALKFSGQTWSVADDALFALRYEKFLSTPEEDAEQDAAHRLILNEIIALLEPSKLKPQSLSEAYRLLTRAANFPGDSRLCDTLSGAIYGIWQSRRSQGQLADANRILEEERARTLHSMAASAGNAQNPANSKPATSQSAQKNSVTATQTFRAASLGENSAAIKANNAKGELSELQAKIQYQGLLVQLFLQRRFHHVLVGTRFYQALFSDGDSRLNLPDSVQNPFSKTAGSANASVVNLESLSNGFIKEVQTGVTAFLKYYEQSKLKAASESLRETLVLGEFMPELRTLPFGQKKVVLNFLQAARRLQEAIQAKDYTTASDLISADGGLAQTAVDFDAASNVTVIATAKTAAGLHLAHARSAANSGDRDAFESEIKLAAAVWPTNPDLLKTAKTAFLSAEVLSAARGEIDRLLSQKAYRLISAQAERFLTAAHGLPEERQNEVRTAIENVKALEANLKLAETMDGSGNSAGAWETVERLVKTFPEDSELHQARVRYAPKAADFVRSVQKAETQEAAAQHATSLAWLLKAQRLYPASSIAAESINRNLAKLFP
jgi:hypothetical protein